MEGFQFRAIRLEDRLQIEELHNQWFPIRYNPEFFDSVCAQSFRTICCVDPQMPTVILGCLVGQVVPHANAEDIDNAFPRHSTFANPVVGHILTVGVRESHRGRRIGELLVNKFVAETTHIPSCLGVFLHVLTTNVSAIHLYERIGFLRIRHFKDYYTLPDRTADAFLYAIHFPITSFPANSSLTTLDNLASSLPKKCCVIL